eukprot:Hpha_TRINITY_DN8955_c0_g1::TRINITY_DN8955_c0_g1_i1::g.80751::m.80751
MAHFIDLAERLQEALKACPLAPRVRQEKLSRKRPADGGSGANSEPPPPRRQRVERKQTDAGPPSSPAAQQPAAAQQPSASEQPAEQQEFRCGDRVLYTPPSERESMVVKVLAVDHRAHPPSYVVVLPDGTERVAELERIRAPPPGSAGEGEPSPAPPPTAGAPAAIPEEEEEESEEESEDASEERRVEEARRRELALRESLLAQVARQRMLRKKATAGAQEEPQEVMD